MRIMYFFSNTYIRRVRHFPCFQLTFLATGFDASLVGANSLVGQKPDNLWVTLQPGGIKQGGIIEQIVERPINGPLIV